jgi:hypothetical protein
MDALGYRYENDVFAPAEHLTLAVDDQFGPAADWLGDRRVDLDPPHVTYSYNPTMDFPAAGTAAGHAYWVSGVEPRAATGDPPVATIDVRSHGFGVGDPPVTSATPVAGALPPGNLGVLGYAGQARSWGAAPPEPKADRLDVTATNVKRVTLDPRRARVGCGARLVVATDGPLSVTLAGCGRTEVFGS